MSRSWRESETEVGIRNSVKLCQKRSPIVGALMILKGWTDILICYLEGKSWHKKKSLRKENLR
jgi:hypothetical protein